MIAELKVELTSPLLATAGHGYQRPTQQRVKEALQVAITAANFSLGTMKKIKYKVTESFYLIVYIEQHGLCYFNRVI